MSVLDLRFPYLGGSIFFIPRLRVRLTTYPPIWDPWSGAPLCTMYVEGRIKGIFT